MIFSEDFPVFFNDKLNLLRADSVRKKFMTKRSYLFSLFSKDQTSEKSKIQAKRKNLHKISMTKLWLYLPSSWLYFLSPIALKIYSRFNSGPPYNWKPVKWRGLSFPNPLGTAGGLDKNALYIKNYWSLGAGFVEVGTVTPKAQGPNPYKILDRSVSHLSLWNNMGFPNKGLDFVKGSLEKFFEKNNNFQTEKSQLEKNNNFQPEKSQLVSPLFINIGKNRDRPISQAIEDYKTSMEALYPFADAFVINISSPNTKGLRELF